MSKVEPLENIDLAKVDPTGMIGHIENFSEMCRDAYKQAQNIVIPPYYIKPKKIVLLGMGGSGQTLEIAKDLLYESDLVIECVHNYIIPGWVDKDTLVIASSHSGNTEEVLAGFITAYQKGAKLIAITTGGKLKTLADKYKAPVFVFTCESAPRAAFPYLFFPLLVILDKLGHLKITQNDVDTTTAFLDEATKKYHSSVSAFQNPAKILAQKLHGHFPVIYATEKLHGVGMRLKAAFNENGKNFAFSEDLPELNHKSLEGLAHPKEMAYILQLESNYEYSRNQIRENVTADVVARFKTPIERVKFIQVKDRLSEICLHILFGDFVSAYLGLLNNENPGINDVVDYLKSHLN